MFSSLRFSILIYLSLYCLYMFQIDTGLIWLIFPIYTLLEIIYAIYLFFETDNRLD